MQEEVTQKTIALSMKTGKLTAQALQAALKKYLQHRAKGPKLHHGKQSLKQLKAHGAALTNIEVTEANVGAFIKPEQLQLGFLKVLKGSFMQEHQKEYGIVHKAHPPYEVLYTKWISYEDVLRLKGVEEMVEVYYNSRQFTNTMEELEKEYDSAFDMYDRLAAYYEENDYNSVQHKRSARYEILLNYVRKYHKEKEDLFREVLTYDYYLRENAKSRPGFAGEYPVTKDAARAFYETEEETHEYLPDYGKYDRNQMRKMTHLEYFKLTDTYILFDYQNRNPLNQEARVCKIEKIKL